MVQDHLPEMLKYFDKRVSSSVSVFWGKIQCRWEVIIFLNRQVEQCGLDK